MSITHSKVSAVPDDGDTTKVQPSDWNDEHTIAAGYFLPRTATVTLTDDQIKTLGTGDNSIEILPAPGENKSIVFLGAVGVLDASAGAYTGSNAVSALVFYLGGGLTVSNLLPPQTSADKAILYFTPANLNIGGIPSSGGFSGQFLGSVLISATPGNAN